MKLSVHAFAFRIGAAGGARLVGIAYRASPSFCNPADFSRSGSNQKPSRSSQCQQRPCA